MASRVFGSLFAFLVCFLLQLGLISFRQYFVMYPQNNMISHVQDLSSFISLNEESLEAYDSFRWDYGDIEDFISYERARNVERGKYLSSLDIEYDSDNKEAYLLSRSSMNLYSTYLSISDEIMDLLSSGERTKASEIYYNKLSYCLEYLSTTMRSLLEETIVMTKISFIKTQTINDRIDNFQSVITLFSLIFAGMLSLTMAQLLSHIKTFSRESKLLGEGKWDIPDINESGPLEIVYMAKAFNKMKHDMKNQVKLLEEKNTIQEELFEKEKESLSLQSLLEEERLQQLRSRINPHFLFNTLNVIKFSAHDEGAEKTEDMLESMALLYRYALGSNSDSVPVSRELRIVVALASLYKARFGDKINLRWNSTLDEDLTEVMVPSFILQPIVENSFRHGIGPKEEGGEVVISISSQNDILSIVVSDNGIGMDEDTLSRVRERIKEKKLGSEHIGIGNVAARVQMLSPLSSFTVESEKNIGTKVIMKMPLLVVKEEN
ncbi:MAG: sensor histidine kinase [Candidatus Ornithospirochaeta sp.]